MAWSLRPLSLILCGMQCNRSDNSTVSEKMSTTCHIKRSISNKQAKTTSLHFCYS